MVRRRWRVSQDKLVLSDGLINNKCELVSVKRFEFLYGGQFTLSTELIKPNDRGKLRLTNLLH